jgi:hypothetical protein
VNATFEAAPKVIVSELLTAVVKEPSAAVNVYVPTGLMLQPANVATPATAFFGFVVQTSAPDGLVIVNVTALTSVVTVLPPASWIVTTGWVVNGAPPIAPLGWVVKANFADTPTVMVNDVLTAVVNTPSVAVNV